MASGKKDILEILNILVSASFCNNCLEGQVTRKILFALFCQNNFLIKFSFGKPEILKINFVLRLNILKIIIGSDVIRCAIKKSGLVLKRNLNKGIKENKIIII